MGLVLYRKQTTRNITESNSPPTPYSPTPYSRVLAENLVGLGFLYKYIKSIPTHEKISAVGKNGPNATFNLIFLGLGWPWVGEFVGFIIFRSNIYMFSDPTKFGESQTPYYIGNVMLQTFVSKLFKKGNLVPPPWENENKNIFFLFFCSHGCTWRNLCFHI